MSSVYGLVDDAPTVLPSGDVADTNEERCEVVVLQPIEEPNNSNTAADINEEGLRKLASSKRSTTRNYDSINQDSGIDEQYLFNSLRCFMRAVECDLNNADAWDNLGTSLKDTKEEVIIKMLRKFARPEKGEKIKVADDSSTQQQQQQQQQLLQVGYGSYGSGTAHNLHQSPTDNADEVVEVIFTQQLCFIRALEIDPLVSSTWNKLGTTIPSGSFDIKRSDATGTRTFVEVDLTRHYVAKLKQRQKVPLNTGQNDVTHDPHQQQPIKHILRLNKRECFARALALDHRNANAWYNLASLLTIKRMTIATMLTGGLIKGGAVGAGGIGGGTEASGIFAPQPINQLFSALSAVSAAKTMVPTANWLAAVRNAHSPHAVADAATAVVPADGGEVNGTMAAMPSADDAAANTSIPIPASLSPSVPPITGAPLGAGNPPPSSAGSRSNSVALAPSMSLQAQQSLHSLPPPDDPYIATINGPFGKIYYFDKKQCLVKVLEAEPEDPYAWYNLACVLKRGEQVEVKMKVIVGGEADGQVAAVVSKGDAASKPKDISAFDPEGKLSLLDKIKISRGLDKKKYQTQMRSVPVTAKDCCLNCLKATNYTDFYAWTKLGQVLGNSETATIVVKDPATKFHVSNPTTLTSTVTGRECFLEALHLNPKYPNAWDGLASVLAKGEKISYTHGQHAAAMFGPPAKQDDLRTEQLSNAACWNKALECDEGYTMAWSNLGYTMTKTEKYPALGVDRTQRECYLCGIGCDEKGINDKAWNGLGINLKASEQIIIPKDPSDPNKQQEDDSDGSPDNESHKQQQSVITKIGKKDAYGRAVLANPYNSSAWNNLGTTLGSTGTTTIDGVTLNEQDCYLRAVSLNNNNSAGWDNLGSTVGGKKGKKGGGDDDIGAAPAGDDDDTASLGSGGSNIFTATIMVNGVPYTRQQCYLKAVQCNKNNSSAWGKLTGTLRDKESVMVAGVPYDRLGCLQKALQCDFENSRAWNRLGKLIDSGAAGSTGPHPYFTAKKESDGDEKKKVGGSDDKEEDGGYAAIPEDTTTEATKTNDELSDKIILPWVEVQGRPYNTKECFIRACESDGTYTIAWYNLGTAVDPDETVIIKKKPYQKKSLYLKAIECDENNINAWNNLGTTLAATEVIVVAGQKVDKLRCYSKALELESNNSSAWANVGCMLMSPAEVAAAEAAAAPNSLPNTSRRPMSGARMRPGSGSRSRPLSAKPTNKLQQTTVVIDGVSYSQIDCFVEAIKCDFNNGTAWSGLGGLLSKEGDTSNPYIKPSSSDLPPTDAVVPDSSLPQLQPHVGNEVLNPSKNALARLATAVVNNPPPSSVSIRGVTYTKQQCYIRAVESDKHSCSAWNNLGTTIITDSDEERKKRRGDASSAGVEGGADEAAASPGVVVVGGRQYTKCDCYLKAVMLDALCARAWANLASAMGPTDRIQYHSAKDKNSEGSAALKTIESVAGATSETDASSPSKSAPIIYSRTEVLAKAAELEPGNSNAWLNLALLGSFEVPKPPLIINAGGGAAEPSQHIPVVLVDGEPISQLDCLLNAVEADPLSTRSWIELAAQMKDEDEERIRSGNSVVVTDPLHPFVVEVDGKSYTRVQIEAKIAEIRTPANPPPTLTGTSSGMLPPRSYSGVGFNRGGD